MAITKMSDFVATIKDEMQGIPTVETYKKVQELAVKHLGAKLQKEQVWMVVNLLQKAEGTVTLTLD